MMIQIIIGVLFASIGTAFLLISAGKYCHLIRLTKKRRYNITKRRFQRQILQLCLIFVFAACYMVSAIQSLAVYPAWLFLFEGVLFFACTLFFYIMIGEQIKSENELQQRKLDILRTFVNAIERKDSYTRGHSEHVYQLVGLLYIYLPREVRASVNQSKLLDAALLHDIGKIGISDEILKKKGVLSNDEWTQMRSHVREGKKLLDDTFFSEIAEWVLYHHERMDGKGYEGLRGNDIPLQSRMIAIADTFSALTTNREYRGAVSYERAIVIMIDAGGTQLDSELLECFLKIPKEHLDLKNRGQD